MDLGDALLAGEREACRGDGSLVGELGLGSRDVLLESGEKEDSDMESDPAMEREGERAFFFLPKMSATTDARASLNSCD